MKSIFYLACLCLLPVYSYAQSLDSLLLLLDTKYVKEDTMRGICLGEDHRLGFPYIVCFLSANSCRKCPAFQGAS